MLHVNLPPSKTKTGKSLKASNGFVSFSIRPKTPVAVGTRLENFADIYFDFNDPIRTNTTVNTLWVPILDPGVLDTVFTAAQRPVVQLNATIHPNPAKGQVEISTTEAGTLQIYDFSGGLVDSRKLNKGQNHLNLSGLSRGIYLIKIQNSNGFVTLKLAVE